MKQLFIIPIIDCHSDLLPEGACFVYCDVDTRRISCIGITVLIFSFSLISRVLPKGTENITVDILQFVMLKQLRSKMGNMF